MQVNSCWKYRKADKYHLLLNIKTNQIFSISSSLGELFCGEDFDEQLSLFQQKYEVDAQTLKDLLVFLTARGVIING